MASTPAVRAVASALQIVTRTAAFTSGDPPACAARSPNTSRKNSELTVTVHASADGGTIATTNSVA